MRADRAPHTAHVDAWLESAFDGLPHPAERRLHPTLQALWQRSKTSLGAPACTAIFARVTADARHRHPVLAELPLVVGDNAEIDTLVQQHSSSNVDERVLRDAARYLLVELLTAVGALTADALTPALHATLQTSPRAHRMHALKPTEGGDQ